MRFATCLTLYTRHIVDTFKDLPGLHQKLAQRVNAGNISAQVNFLACADGHNLKDKLHPEHKSSSKM